MLEQVEKAIEIVKAQKESKDFGSMRHDDSETVLKCLYRLHRILLVREISGHERKEWYD